MLSEDHKQRLAAGRKKYLEKRARDKKEAVEKAKSEKKDSTPPDAFASGRVLKREKVTSLPVEATSDQLLKLAEQTLTAAKALTDSALALVKAERVRSAQPPEGKE